MCKMLSTGNSIKETVYLLNINPPYQDALLHPAILHYTNRKPWEYHCMHPLRKLFYDYQNLTPYAGQSVLNNPLKRIHRFIHLLPYLLGFKQKRYYSLSTLRENQ